MINNPDTDSLENDSNDLDKIDKDITKHRLRAILIIILVVVLYLFLEDKTLSSSAQSWGTFGDFIGGILNPIFALFAFYWLTYSVRLQIKELKDTRIELQKAANAQVETAKHQENIAMLEKKNVNTQQNIFELQVKSLKTQMEATEAQQKQISIQNFESLFAQLLKAKKDSVNDIVLFGTKYRTTKLNPELQFHGKDAIKSCIHYFKSNKECLSWEKYYTTELLDFFGSYFRINYHIINLINNNVSLREFGPRNSNYSQKQKEYFDIFRATLTQHELEIIFFNCLCSYGSGKFKKLIEIYGLFEPLIMDFNYPTEKYNRLTQHAYKYSQQAFEKNVHWIKYFEDLQKIDIFIDPIEIMKNVEYLKNTGIHRGFNGHDYGLLNFERIKQEITNKINLYTKKFQPHTVFDQLNLELQNQYNEFNIFKTVIFNYEMYMVLKYEINLEEYINLKKSKLTPADNLT